MVKPPLKLVECCLLWCVSVQSISVPKFQFDGIGMGVAEKLPVLFIVRAGVAKNTKIQCTTMKLITQLAILATFHKSIDS